MGRPSRYEEFQDYLDYVIEALGHANREEGFTGYCQGLMLPIERKSVEPMAGHLDPKHVSSKHQSLHHFVADSAWSDDAVLERVRSRVLPEINIEKQECYWIFDDTGHPKQGKHSVGVARQYCGMLGKQDNCQVAVSLSIATKMGSLPVQYQLYLPKEWADDHERRKKAGVPVEISFATKTEIASHQLKRVVDMGVRKGIVLADAGYGDDTSFRENISEQGLQYSVGIRPATTVWKKGTSPLPPPKWSGLGRKPKNMRIGPGHEPIGVKKLALSLPKEKYKTVTWREGSNKKLTSRFAALRVRAAHMDQQRVTQREEEWLLIEWPEGDSEPLKYWLSTLPVSASVKRLVYVAKMRYLIERDYQELKQELGLSHYEGRGWRGFHHHATLCIAAYAFLLEQRCKERKTQKKYAYLPEKFALPRDFIPRGSPESSASCSGFYSNSAMADRKRDRIAPGSMPVLPKTA